MTITTLAKNTFFHIVLLLALLSQNNKAFSQCPTVSNAIQSFCDTQLPTVANLVATDNGGGIRWYANATGGTPLLSSVALINGQDYFADDNTGSCGPRQGVVVTILSAPTGANFQGVCVTNLTQATPLNPQFSISGNNLQWYTVPTGGTAISNSTVLNDNTIYYISQTDPASTCQTSRLPVFVNVGLVPTPSGNLVQEFCNVSGNTPTVADLVASGNNNWYLTSSFGIPLDPSTPLINGQFYYATTVDPPCESSTRLEVLVNIFEPNDAGSDGNIGICVNQISSTVPFDLFNLLGGTPDNNGVWSGPVVTSNGFQGTLDVSTLNLSGSPYVFTYTVSSSACVSDVSTVTITILPLPTVVASVSPLTICSGTSATVTFTGTPDATVTYNINGGTNQTITLNGSGIATLTNNYFTNTTVNVLSISTNSSPSCINSQPNSFDITVIPLPTATASFSPATVCSNSTSTLTFTGTPNATVTFTINGSANQTIVLDVSGTATVSGTYIANTTVTLVSITTAGTPSCTNALTQTVTLTVRPEPNAGNDANLPICSNVNPVDMFPLLGANAQTGGVWRDPSNAIVTNILNPATAVNGVYTYTVLGIAPCVDDEAQITVSITLGPEAGVSGSFSICENVAPYDLFQQLGVSAQSGGVWTNPSNVVVSGIFNPAVDPIGNYTYTLTGNLPCSNDQAVIAVSLSPSPDAGISTTPPIICSNDAPVDLFTLLGGTPQVGGVWTNSANVIVSNIFNPAVGVSDIFTYTVLGGFGCTPDSATVTITVEQSPNAGIDGTLSTCVNSTSLNLLNGLDGTQDLGTFSDDNATGALSGTFFNPSLVLPGSYNFTYTASGGVSPCVSDTAVVTVIVNPLPNAGNAVTIAPVCTSVGTIDLNTLLTGQDAGGTWSAITPVDISSFAAGTYTYAYSVTNSCGQDNQDVSFTVLPSPVVASSNITISPICIGLDVTVNLSGTVDGTYTLNYDLTGSNTLTNENVTVSISGGNGSFTIPTANVPNTGTTTITFNTIQDTTNTCQVTLNNVSGVIVINPIVQIDNTNIAVATVCIGSAATVVISNATNLPDGVYQFNYSIPTGTPTTGNSGDVTITGGIGQFTIPASVFAAVGNYTITISSIITTTGCSNIIEDANTNFEVVAPLTAGTFTGIVSICPSTGVLDLNSLLSGEDVNGVWTDSSSTVVTSPITIISFPAGTYSYTYTVTNSCGTDTEVVQFAILPNPQLTSINVSTSPTCIGSSAVINLNGLADGVYTLSYDLLGSNTLSGQSVTVTITAGIGSFTVPSASLLNVGTTVISFTNILNTVTNCSNTLVNVTTQIIVRPLADIDSLNLNSIAICFGGNVIVTISNAINLTDGVYQFNYSIPGATPTTGNSGDVTITSGVGQFTIPSSVFTSAGNYTLTVIGIIAPSGCTNTTENATVALTIDAIPNASTATVSAQDTCPNSDTNVTIAGISNLPDGTYSLTYLLSGANSGTATISVTFTNGGTTFTIPGVSLVNNGQTTVQIIDLTSTSNTCGLNSVTALLGNFNVVSDPAPVLIDRGELFCGTTIPAPTIADLSANIVGTPTVIWYDALTGGTAYSASDLLINGTTYYAAVISATGCESVRLPVTVDLTICDIIIPDGFSPNNDGINDTFEIPNLAILYPNFKLEIYNRYGSLIYTGNRNTPNWDGTATAGGVTLGNNLLPTGVYFYILYFNDGARKDVQGRVYLNR